MSELLITCDCGSHEPGADKARLTGLIAETLATRTGKELADKTHGYVTLANHPARMIRVSNARKGIHAK